MLRSHVSHTSVLLKSLRLVQFFDFSLDLVVSNPILAKLGLARGIQQAKRALPPLKDVSAGRTARRCSQSAKKRHLNQQGRVRCKLLCC